jgi:hypothetical protein
VTAITASIVAVDVKDGRTQHFRHIAAISGGTGILGIGGKADLVVDQEMHCTASGKARRAGQLQGLHQNALAAKRRIAMDEHGQHFGARRVATPILAGAHRTFDHRIGALQVRGIERQRHVHVTAAGFDIGRKAEVVFDVAGAFVLLRVVSPLELGEQLLRGFAHDIDQHVDAPAVRHADDDFLDVLPATLLDDIVQLRNERLAAFQGKALLADIAGMQKFLDPFGGGERSQNRELFVLVELDSTAAAFDALPEPTPLLGVRHVHIFVADRAAIHFIEHSHDLP